MKDGRKGEREGGMEGERKDGWLEREREREMGRG